MDARPTPEPSRRALLAAAGLLPLALAACRDGGTAAPLTVPEHAGTAGASGAAGGGAAAGRGAASGAAAGATSGSAAAAAPSVTPLRSGKPGRYTVSYVGFDQVTPAGLKLQACWDGVGVDDQGRAYLTWNCTRKDGRQDTAVFRYTRATGRREFLGTYIEAATAAGNVRPGEEIPKGHTRVIQVDRRMYMGSQSFHDFKGALTTLPTYRGAHLFAYDLDKGVLTDASAKQPGGVLVQHQGVVALGYSPEHHLLVGLCHPLGDLLLIDPASGAVRKKVTGIPWALDKVVSREIVVTKAGKVYTYRGPEVATLREQQNEVWVYDLATGTMKRTGTKLKGGFWNGQAQTASRDTVYLSTVAGNLYVLDVRTGRFTAKGTFVDPADYAGRDKYRVKYLYGIALSATEDAVTGVPVISSSTKDGPDIARMTAYSVAKGTFTRYTDQSVAVFAGSDHRDAAGYVYQAAFDWDHNCKLAVLKPS